MTQGEKKSIDSHRSTIEMRMADAVRFLSVDAVQRANSGHPGLPMGMADVATVLFTKVLKTNPAAPDWFDRDRFIFSAGHGSMMLYAANYLLGYAPMTLDEIKNFRQYGALTAGHPEVDVAAGIEMTTGPLGQGVSSAVGFALAERHLNARFGDDLVDHYTYVIASDGDLMEGISHEACSLAGHLKLDRLIVLYDSNNISIDGDTDLSFTDDTPKRFQSYGWDVQTIDGHDPEAILSAIEAAQKTDTPSLIECRTTIGFGSPNKAGKSSAHGSPLGDDEIAATRKNLGWDHPAFEIPDDVLTAWRNAGKRHDNTYNEWKNRLKKSDHSADFNAAMNNDLPDELDALIHTFKQAMLSEKPGCATRKSSGMILGELVPFIENMVGGSADLTPSNNTHVGDMDDIKPQNYGGRYVRYGVREHGMAAIMNGMALHGGIIPYAGTFLTFSDYMRPSIRLAALMKQRVIHVHTHDSIGLGEDGPTHQPIEHLAALRAIPNLQVLRPADSIETAECWQMALEKIDGPSVLALSRQPLPDVREIAQTDNLCRLGGYVLRETDTDYADLTLIASGSEVSLAIDVSRRLLKDGMAARVVSMPCREVFLNQPLQYRHEVLGRNPRFVIEAGIRMPWDRVLRPEDIFFGIDTFGESAPIEDVYRHFGLTTNKIAEKIMDYLALSD